MDTVRPEALTDEQLRERARGAGVLDPDGLDRAGLLAALDSSAVTMTRSEERLVPSTEVVETGRARLRKYVVTEEVQVTVQVRREELRLEHDSIPPAEQRLAADPDVFGPAEVYGGPDGGVLFEVVLHEERPLVSTEIVPVQRVRLTKVVHTDEHVLSGEVRKERIEADLPDGSETLS